MAAPLTLAQFRDQFPEFEAAPDPFVQARLDAAWRRTPTDVWGDLSQDRHAYLTAHLLSLSPYGRAAQLNEDRDGASTYERELRRMELEMGPAATPRTT